MSTPPLTRAAFLVTGIMSGSSQPNVECSICYEPLVHDVVRTVACQHSFHRSCITQWTSGEAAANRTCPLCREVLFILPEDRIGMTLLTPGGPYPHRAYSFFEYSPMGDSFMGNRTIGRPRDYATGYGDGVLDGLVSGIPRLSQRTVAADRPGGRYPRYELPYHPHGPTAPHNLGGLSAHRVEDIVSDTRRRTEGLRASLEEVRRQLSTLRGHPSQDLPHDRERSPTRHELAEDTPPDNLAGLWTSFLNVALPRSQDTTVQPSESYTPPGTPPGHRRFGAPDPINSNWASSLRDALPHSQEASQDTIDERIREVRDRLRRTREARERMEWGADAGSD